MRDVVVPSKALAAGLVLIVTFTAAGGLAQAEVEQEFSTLFLDLAQVSVEQEFNTLFPNPHGGSSPVAPRVVENGVTIYFNGYATPPAGRTLGVAQTGPVVASSPTQARACPDALLAAIKVLAAQARSQGGNAVLRARSDMEGPGANVMAPDRYTCNPVPFRNTEGLYTARVRLSGTVVLIDQSPPLKDR